MKWAVRVGGLVLGILAFGSNARGQINHFAHVVLIVQENRTPDNLFQGLCLPPYGNNQACGTAPGQYDLQGFGIDIRGQKIALTDTRLGNAYNPGHGHGSFVSMCDLDAATNRCLMDGLSSNQCPNNCSFQYVHPADVQQYLELAQQYGWANSMFQTNQGPSAPAHQFLFGGTSAPSAADDAQARFVAENVNTKGCLAPLNAVFPLIDPQHLNEYPLVNNPLGTVCFSRNTMGTLFDNHVPAISWKYYSAGSGLWTAPNWIREICQPNANYTKCMGPEWGTKVDLKPADVLTDIANCKLPEVTWVTPTGQNSDHPGKTGLDIGGPAWVASIVNAIGNSWQASRGRCDYWGNHSNDATAVIVTWDDWGGFYDHRAPMLLSVPSQGQGDYQLGFRVPLVVVSAYTNHVIDSANQYDFGSILRFMEQNFGFSEGALGMADARAQTDLTGFFNLKQKPRPFVPIASPVGAEFFLHDPRPMDAPDEI